MADTVLKPFQIRNLHVYPAEENLYDSSTESVISSSPADETQTKLSCPIQLSAGEYDKIISDHPGGTLTYIDDDDGDLITVGSSFELEQRLDEPSQYKAIISPDPEPAPIHLFDIRRRRSIIKLWKDIEMNSKIRWAQPNYPESEDESSKEPKSTEAGTSFEPRGLDVNESTDLRQRWLDACRPPRLQPQETLVKEVPSPVLKDMDSSSPTIMSLSAITDEGRRQAEEAGSRIRSMWNAPTGVSHAAPDFIRNQENPSAATVEPVTDDNDNSHPSEYQPTKSEAESQPLLSAFEAEMAKILENSRDSVDDANTSIPPPEPQAHRPESMEQIWPVNLVTGVLQAVADGIENMGSELKTRIPEMERHLANAQRTIPEDIGTKMQTALSAFESQIQNLAQVVQQASDASGEAAERVRQADLRSTEEMLNGLGDMAHEFEDFGKTLFAAFEAEFGQRSNSDNANGFNPTTASQDANPAQSQTQEEASPSVKVDLPQESLKKASEAVAPAAYQRSVPPAPLSPGLREQLPPHIRESLLSELENATSQVLSSDIKSKPIHHNQPKPQVATSPRESILSEIRSRATPETSLLPEIISRATQQDSQHPEIKSRVTQQESLSSEIRSRAMQNNQSQTRMQETEKPLFSSWPNRPAFVLPPAPAVPQQQAVNISQTTSPFHTWASFQPPSIPTTTRPPVPPKTANDKPTPRTDAQPAAPSETRDERSQDTSKSLFMGNIGFEVTERVIEDVFASHLFSAKVHLPVDSSTGKHAGFGYAHFPSVSSAKAALSRLQGVVIDGHSLNLEYCDNSPIDDLQTQARPNDSLPSVFSSNARSINSRVSRPAFAQGSSSNPFDHPEETPEFAARYPSLLPTFKSQDNSLAVPARSMTLSPNSEIARFPPVSQIDAHLLANNQRLDHETSQGPPRPHSVTGPQQQEPRRVSEEHRMRKPRRVASTIHRGSANPFDTQTGNVHSLRRRATEANSLRRRAHENPFRDPRPVSLYDRPTGSIPGSFPVDDAPAPVTSNDESNTDGEIQYAMRQSLIDQCVDHLLKLGYGTYIDGGRDRLRIIAEAANLQVSDAIDMIEEERMAYERYTPNA
ncbi:RNA binding protein [Talaromyces pinophilus]|uniref:RNA binding protein n=1 Tax=Talaromyces pinophilus TaxID=128442 RepID=A0A6V8HK49_TALPI|nr:RNA binding protein [Talaromyces pinophilus]